MHPAIIIGTVRGYGADTTSMMLLKIGLLLLYFRINAINLTQYQ